MTKAVRDWRKDLDLAERTWLPSYHLDVVERDAWVDELLELRKALKYYIWQNCKLWKTVEAARELREAKVKASMCSLCMIAAVRGKEYCSDHDELIHELRLRLDRALADLDGRDEKRAQDKSCKGNGEVK